MSKRGLWGVTIAFLLIVTVTVVGVSTGSIERSDFLVENTQTK